MVVRDNIFLKGKEYTEMQTNKCWGRRVPVCEQPPVDEVVKKIKRERAGIAPESYYKPVYPKQFVQSKRLNKPLKQPVF